MDELTAALVPRPRRRRLKTIRRTAHRHLSRSLRDERPCPCPIFAGHPWPVWAHLPTDQGAREAQQTSNWTLVLPGRRERPFGQLGHAVLEAIEERILGRAGQPTLVGTLEEDRGLPQGERGVPVDVAHRAPRALFVAGDERLAGGKARAPGDGAQRQADALRVARLRPGGGEVAQVGERV